MISNSYFARKNALNCLKGRNIVSFLDHIKPNTLAVPALLLAGFTVACAPIDRPPREVSSSKPTVTYKYDSDEDLYEADQRASGYCAKYNLVPNATDFMTNESGQKIVTYDCLPASAPAFTSAPAPMNAAATPASPSLSYSYRTDRELLTASRNARVYCMNNGMQSTVTNTTVNPNGTKTIHFQCVQ